MHRLAVLAILSPLACSGASAPEEDQVSYCVVQPIFEARCLACHDDPLKNGASIFLNTYESAYRARGILPHWVGEYRMPPANDPNVIGSELTEAERSLILQWVDDGAKDCAD